MGAPYTRVAPTRIPNHDPDAPFRRRGGPGRTRGGGMKSRPHPGLFAHGEVLFVDTDDPRFQDHDGVCKGCGDPLWMHDRERVYPDDGPPGSYHYKLVCREDA